ncbi:uncharacterized protein [Nicotiana tomentosiformis]|uniref:uncharacterized protein n=1 Tax=Nicotiana tomentosiformis TaxID=4098 RepID=UPI00388C5225
MDTSYNFLLGRPWIHAAGASPSTLHQMVKFEHENQVVHGEDEHSNNADLNNMTCLRTSCPDPKTLSNPEIMNQEPEYDEDDEVNSVEVIPEDTKTWKIFFDGAVNAKGVGIGAILISPMGQHYPDITRLWFFCTNNTAEYEACIMGMNMAIDMDVEELLIMGDFDLIIRQAQGEWETRDIKLIPYQSIEFRYIPRFHNELADALATLAAMMSYPGNVHIDPLEIQIRERHGYCNTVKVEPNDQPWYHDIKRFLKTKEYLEQANVDQKRTIRRLADSFFLSGEVLYKRTPDLNLLRCVDAKEAEKIMNEVHSGVYGPPHKQICLGKENPVDRLLLDDHGKGLL